MARHRLVLAVRSCFYASRTELGARSQCRRPYSIQSQEETIAKLPGINPSALSITNTITPKELVPSEKLVFGRTFTGKLPSSLNNLDKN